MTDVDDGHHFSGFNSRLITEYLLATIGRPALDELLSSIGEDRPVEVLTDDTSWSSYRQFRRLLEATAQLVGEDGVREIGCVSVLTTGHAAEDSDALRQLGSAAALLREAAASGTGLGVSTLLEQASIEDDGDGTMVFETRFRQGFEPFREWCWYFQGLIAMSPKLFGLPPATVAEEACQCDGGAYCRVRVELPKLTTEDLPIEEQLEHARSRIDGLQARLDSIQETVAELVAAADIDETLSRIGRAAARVVRAPAFVLHLPGQRAASTIVSSGLDERRLGAVVAGLAEDLDADADADGPPGTLEVAITSGRTVYGSLVLVERGRNFRPHERAAVESYARLAAAALDNAASLSEARRQATTANALLELSTALGEARSEREMAELLARAAPAVIDCDRALVSLALPDGSGRIAACHGYPPKLARRLTGAKVSFTRDRVPHKAVFIGPDTPGFDPSMAAIMGETGSLGGVSAPIEVEGRTAGFLVATVTERPERLVPSPALEERLRGLVGQAQAAIHNSRLLDAVRHQAMHDALTGLPNRVLILDRARHLLERSRRETSDVAVVFVDLDGFKEVNDDFGHGAGDDLLRSAAERLSGAVRDGDTVGRIGGDEFVVLLEGADLPDGPLHVGSRILEAFRAPFDLPSHPGRQVEVTASLGVASGSPMDVSELLRDADLALYQAKAEGKNRMVVFDPELGSIAEERRALEADLQAAIGREEFFLLYQPLFNLKQLEMTGVEALLRWRHPTRGVLSPGDFLALLEHSGLIVPVGRFVLGQACAQAAAWRAGGHLLDMSVNVSWRQLDAASFVGDLKAVLERTGLPPGSLILDVAESSVMRDSERAAERLRDVRALGVRVAIDDFGAAYSSIAALSSLPVDALKIDRRFVAELAGSAESQALVRNFVELARAFRLETFAEGIEELGQLAQLVDEECQSGQGFLLARPTDVAGIEHLFLRRAPVPATEALGES
ncbi:MAG: EAL domain-containing protein [Acidimicrobiales bacterium]